MTVLPKKRVHHFTQYLMLSRNLSLPRSFSFLRNLFLRVRLTALRGVDLMRFLASRVPVKYGTREGSFLHGTLKIPSPKGFLKIPFGNLLNSRFVWFSASLAMYGYFLYQIANDIFIFHRTIAQVSLTNYVGVSMAMALIWSGTVIFKMSPTSIPLIKKTLKTIKGQRSRGKAKNRTSTLASSTTFQIEPLSSGQAAFAPELQLELPIDREPLRKKATATSKCANPLTSSQNIPDACLVCKELISCLSRLE